MIEGGDLDKLRRQVGQMMRDLRRMPAAIRKAMDDEAQAIGDRTARRIDQAAGSVPHPGRVYAVALRRGGIRVKPGRGELQIVIGGPAASGIGRMSMRQIAAAAEFGGGGRRARYVQRHARRSVEVTRHVTHQFGRPAAGGRFVYPTWEAMSGANLDAWVAAVDRVLDDYWQGVASA